LVANTSYEFQLTATNAGGSATSTTDVTTESEPIVVNPPEVPVELRSTGKTENSITLTWETATGADYYEVMVNGAALPDTFTETMTVIGNLTADTEYTFQVRAVNDDRESEWSESITVETDSIEVNPPIVPEDFVVDNKTYSSITLTWTPESDVTYTLEIKGGSLYPDWSSDWTGTMSKGTATLDGLTDNTLYEFRLTATNAGGSVDTTTSETTDVKPEDAPDAPHFNDTTSGSTSTVDSVTLTWTAQDDVTYTLEYREKGKEDWTTWERPSYCSIATTKSSGCTNQ
jgi:hypothetical protein